MLVLTNKNGQEQITFVQNTDPSTVVVWALPVIPSTVKPTTIGHSDHGDIALNDLVHG